MTVHRKPGRPRRTDGLDPNSKAARKLRGAEVVSVSLPRALVERIDAQAAALGVSRPEAIARKFKLTLTRST